MRNPLLTLGLAAALLAALALSPASAEEWVAVKAKTVITATGEEFSPGVIVLRDGKVEAVGQKVELPPKARVIEAPNEVVMPGLVLAQRESGSRSRSGNLAHVTVGEELFLRAGDLKPFLENGFSVVSLTPRGSGIPGQALVLRPTDGELDDLTLHGAGYLLVTMSSLPRDKDTLRGAFKEAEQWIERIEKAKKAWEEKQKKLAEAKKKAEAAKKKAEAEKKKGQGDKPAPKPAPKPTPKKRPVPGPRPQPKPVPRRAPLDGDTQSGELQSGELQGEDPHEGPREPLRGKDAAEVLGHDHDDPHAGKEAPLIGVDPLAEQKGKGKGKQPETFKAPEAPERAQVFMVYVQKPGQGLRVLLQIAKASDYLHYVDGFEARKLDPAFRLDLSSRRGESDLFRIVERLGEVQADVLLEPVLTYEPYTRTQRNLPLELQRAGCALAFAPTRSLDDYFGQVSVLVRGGLDRTAALKAMTSGPAKLLGLEKEVGAIKKGLRGDLTFLSGDPFAPGTRVTRVMIDGEQTWSREDDQ